MEDLVNSRERLLAAIGNEKVDRPPVWLMRQAGRYLPEYKKIRSKHSFWEMMRTPELACEVTLQPLRRYGMDAVILFCDILVVPDAMNMEVAYKEGGPVITPLIRSPKDLDLLADVNASIKFDYVAEAVSRIVKVAHPDTGVIGFAGAPFTLAAYMLAGGPSKNVNQLKNVAYNQPQLFDDLIERIAVTVADLLAIQIEAGVDVVQLFDTWAWHLSPEDYSRYALPATKKVISILKERHPTTPITVYLRNAAGHLEAAATSGCQVLSVDCSISLADARKRLDPSIALQGNMDPAILTAPEGYIKQTVQQMTGDASGGGYIANLGTGLVPDDPVEGVGHFIKAVQNL